MAYESRLSKNLSHFESDKKIAPAIFDARKAGKKPILYYKNNYDCDLNKYVS
jgi:hypothetical protein